MDYKIMELEEAKNNFTHCKLLKSYKLDVFDNLVPSTKLKNPIPSRKLRGVASLMVSRNIQHISDCRISWKIIRQKVWMFCLALASSNHCGASRILLKKYFVVTDESCIRTDVITTIAFVYSLCTWMTSSIWAYDYQHTVTTKYITNNLKR